MATVSNLVIEQGANFTATVAFTDAYGSAQSLAGYTANCQMRKSYNSSNTVIFTANISDAANGEITISLSATKTASIKYGRYVYDLKVSNATQSLRIIEGVATVLPEVSKT